MANYWYISPDPQGGPARAAVLGCGWLPAVPAQAVQAVGQTPLPVVIIAGAGQSVVLSEPTTPAAIAVAAAPIVAAEQASATAAANIAANAATIQAALTTRLGQIEAWIAANPSGATLTAAQTLTVGKMLAQLARLLLQMTSTVGQAN